jgi:hypothetical protein
VVHQELLKFYITAINVGMVEHVFQQIRGVLSNLTKYSDKLTTGTNIAHKQHIVGKLNLVVQIIHMVVTVVHTVLVDGWEHSNVSIVLDTILVVER